MRHPTGPPPVTAESEVQRDAELEHLDIGELYHRLDRLTAPALERRAFEALPAEQRPIGVPEPDAIDWASYNAQRERLVAEIELREVAEAEAEVARYDRLLAELPDPADAEPGQPLPFEAAEFEEVRRRYKRCRTDHARQLENAKAKIAARRAAAA